MSVSIYPFLPWSSVICTQVPWQIENCVSFLHWVFIKWTLFRAIESRLFARSNVIPRFVPEHLSNALCFLFLAERNGYFAFEQNQILFFLCIYSRISNKRCGMSGRLVFVLYPFVCNGYNLGNARKKNIFFSHYCSSGWFLWSVREKTQHLLSHNFCMDSANLVHGR